MLTTCSASARGEWIYSTVSNFAGDEVVERLTIVGSVFLPLSFISSFFGMNFTWLITADIAGRNIFQCFASAGLLVTVSSLHFFKRKGSM